MRVYVVLIIKDKEPTRVFGVFKDRQAAFHAASKLAQEGADSGDDDWYAELEECEVQEDASDDIDLQQQVEALQAYVDVMQKKVRLLDNVLTRLLWMSHIREGLGEEVAKILRDDLYECRRTTDYIKER